MFILPKNEPQKPIDTPRNFFVWGATMSGKSYLANEFPNPIVLNTDGNAKANEVPSIQLVNKKDRNGKITKGVPEQVGEILLALATQKHSYETVVIDVVDDVFALYEQYIKNAENVDSLSEVGYGKGYSILNSLIMETILDLKALPLNVVYISRQVTKLEGQSDIELPSLKEKYVNMVNGNCDLNIQTKKIGKTYIRRVEAKRKNYVREQVEDVKILSILDSISGVFERTRKTPISKQNAIANKIVEKQEEEFLAPKEEPKTEKQKNLF